MRARKATKRSPIRYLLLADQKLQRISIKKISARLKKARQSSRARSAASARRGERLRTPGSGAMAILLVGACVIGAAALIARQPSRQLQTTNGDMRVTTVAEDEQTRTVASRTHAKKPTAATAPMAPVAGPTSSMPATPAKMPAAETPKLPTVSNVQALAPVTISGCLEMARGTFRLKDTTGTDAPKSRSWKSGFIRKRSSQIEVVDDANTLKLPTYVGQRVVATGTLANGEMRARSLKRVAASCD